MKTICTALTAAALLAGSSAAFAGSRENVALSINAGRVDFANPEAVAKLRENIAAQIKVACNPGDRVGADITPDYKCRREMAASMEPKVRQLVMAATNGLPN